MEQDRAQRRRQALKQQVVSNLRGKLRAECMKRGQDMRAALLSSRRASLHSLGATAQPQSNGATGTAHEGPAGSQLSQDVTHQVASHVRRDVQQAIAASLAEMRPAGGHGSTGSLGAEGHPVSPAIPGAASSQGPAATPTGLATPSNLSHHPGTQEVEGRPAIDWSGLRAGPVPTAGLFDAQGWLFDDELLDKEITAFTQEDMEEVARQLEVELFEEVLAAQLQDLLQYQAQLAQHGEVLSAEQAARQVLCPVCRAVNLVQLSGVLACPAEGWQLDVRAESITLEHLKQQLADVYEGQADAPVCNHKVVSIREPLLMDVSSHKWLCYFLLGAGVLAPWNAFITATDYYQAAFPNHHVDRLFTICYLPTCLLLLVVFLVNPNPSSLPSPHVRITACYAIFTALLALVPVVDAVRAGSADHQSNNTHDGSSSQQSSLVLLMLAVVLVGALDGACQGAVFSDAAHHAPEYTQAVAAGTACSGFLVSLLRIMCKAAWAATTTTISTGTTSTDTGPSSPSTDHASISPGMRASTATYFALGALITASCTVVYRWVLPHLLQQAYAGCATSTTHAQHHQGYEMTPLATVSLARPFLDVTGSRESAPLLAPPGQTMTSDGGGRQAYGHTHTAAGSTAHKASSAAGSDDRFGVDGDESERGTQSTAHLLGRLLHGRQSHSAGDDTTQGTAWEHTLGSQLVHAHHVHQQRHHVHHGSGADVGNARDMQYASRTHQLRFCLTRLWPHCAALFLTYACTLCIFPGFLAEDIHSDALGDWYPLLVIATFNAADLAGKLLGPSRPPTHDPDNPSHVYRSEVFDPGCYLGSLEAHIHAHYNRFISRLSHQPVLLTALAAARGAKMLIVFAIAAAYSAPPAIIIPSTIALGVSNGWLTVAAMAQGPLHVATQLAEIGEGLLVCSLVSGLLLGAFLGWVWLL